MPKNTATQMTEKAKQWIRMDIANCSRKEILQKIFNVDLETATDREINRCDCAMWRWKNHPQYEREWQKAWKEAWGKLTYKAMKVVNEGMDDNDLPWRKTQSANLALTYGQKNLVGDEASAVKVEIVGMPDIGTPDQDG